MYDHYQALIFDMDGTLIESGMLHERAWISALELHHIPVDRQLMQSLAGVPTDKTVDRLLKHFKLTDSIETESVAHAKEAFVSAHKLDYIKPTKLADVAHTYAGKKPMAVGTGATRQEAEVMLEACGLLDLFEAVIGATDVTNHKPEPDTFLEAARRLKVAPEQCLVFEDSPLGLQAARAANMHCIDVQKELGIINEYFF